MQECALFSPNTIWRTYEPKDNLYRQVKWQRWFTQRSIHLPKYSISIWWAVQQITFLLWILPSPDWCLLHHNHKNASHFPHKIAQQNSHFISHLLDMVITQWQNSDSVVTVANCWQHRDWAAKGSVVTMLLAVIKVVTTLSPLSHHVVIVSNRWLKE